MPVGDWQFWVVSMLAGAAVLAGLWSMRPRRRASRATLTIDRRPVDPAPVEPTRRTAG